MENQRESITASLNLFNEETLELLRRYGLLYSLVRRQIIEEVTVSLTIPGELIQQALNNYCHKNHIKDESALNNWLIENQSNKKELLHQLSLPLKISKLALNEFGIKAEARFLERKEELDQVTYRLIRVKDSGLAHELYLQLEAKETDFESLATDYSEGPEKRSKGLVGPTSLKKAHPKLQKLLRTATPGVVLEPIVIEQWWVVARLEERNEASFDDTMRQGMASELLEDWLTNETKAVVKSLCGAEDRSSLP